MRSLKWSRLKELFNEALARTSEERAAFLAEACGDDAALRAEIDRLLAAHTQAGSFIDHPMSPPQPFGPGAVLRHRYRLESEVARGGMGIVYRATDIELHRNVAIKVLPETVSSDRGHQQV